MKIYIVIIEYRHYDVNATPFSDKERAISWARDVAVDMCKDKKCYKELDKLDNGLLFCAKLSTKDGDVISVVERELDGEVEQ